MANITLNIAKGRIVEFYHRVKNNDPANCAFLLIPIQTTGLETDAVLRDKDTLADFLVGTTDEQITMGRKILTDVELAVIPAPDDSGDKFQVSLPTTTYVAAAGNPISKFLVAFDYDTTSGTDATIVPCSLFDFVVTPTGVDVSVTTGPFFEAV